MKRSLGLIAVAVLMTFSLASGQDKKPSKKRAPDPRLATFTGCIDQRGEDYVLTGDKELRTHAILHGDGFSDDNFAREMGHKVTVEGALAGDADPKTIRVKKVTKIADTCSPD